MYVSNGLSCLENPFPNTELENFHLIEKVPSLRFSFTSKSRCWWKIDQAGWTLPVKSFFHVGQWYQGCLETTGSHISDSPVFLHCGIVLTLEENWWNNWSCRFLWGHFFICHFQLCRWTEKCWIHFFFLSIDGGHQLSRA